MRNNVGYTLTAVASTSGLVDAAAIAGAVTRSPVSGDEMMPASVVVVVDGVLHRVIDDSFVSHPSNSVVVVVVNARSLNDGCDGNTRLSLCS